MNNKWLGLIFVAIGFVGMSHASDSDSDQKNAYEQSSVINSLSLDDLMQSGWSKKQIAGITGSDAKKIVVKAELLVAPELLKQLSLFTAGTSTLTPVPLPPIRRPGQRAGRGKFSVDPYDADIEDVEFNYIKFIRSLPKCIPIDELSDKLSKARE